MQDAKGQAAKALSFCALRLQLFQDRETLESQGLLHQYNPVLLWCLAVGREISSQLLFFLLHVFRHHCKPRQRPVLSGPCIQQCASCPSMYVLAGVILSGQDEPPADLAGPPCRQVVISVQLGILQHKKHILDRASKGLYLRS